MPGAAGDANAPMMASVASVARSASVSNQRSEDRPRGARQQFDCRRQVGFQPAHAAEERPQSGPIAQTRAGACAELPAVARQQVRRRVSDDRFKRARDPVEQGVVARIRLGIALAEPGDRLPVGRGVRSEQQMASVRKRRER